MGAARNEHAAVLALADTTRGLDRTPRSREVGRLTMPCIYGHSIWMYLARNRSLVERSKYESGTPGRVKSTWGKWERS